MESKLVSGIERAIFGVDDRGDVDAWLGAHVQRRLGVDMLRVNFRSGRVAAVYGIGLSDGREVVVKVHRRPVNLAYLRAVVSCQRQLFEADYPCPEPLDGPATTQGRTAVIETLLADGEVGNGHAPGTRRVMARALFEQLGILRGGPVDDLLSGSPPWTKYEQGPWPRPHDLIFDFTSTPQAFTWLSDLAWRATGALKHAGPRDSIAHADWTCGNIRFRNGRIRSSYDWDSLAAASEPVLVAVAASSFTLCSNTHSSAPTTAEVTGFFRDYEEARSSAFNAAEQGIAAAAVSWVLAYNARCKVSSLRPDEPPPQGSALKALADHGDEYFNLRW